MVDFTINIKSSPILLSGVNLISLIKNTQPDAGFDWEFSKSYYLLLIII